MYRDGAVSSSAKPANPDGPRSSEAQPLRVNNFDLIRLVAAGQVLALHAIAHLDADSLRPLAIALWYFPGVPVFFVISGFLISMSWDRAPSLRQYLWNRMLRIYPALWVCLAVSIAIFMAAGVRPSLREFMPWLVAQLTIVQFYNPDFLRGFGVGVINGSLWTIAVELQFYIFLPLFALVLRRLSIPWWAVTVAALIVMVAVRPLVTDPEAFRAKLLSVTLAPYLFYFLVGIIARQIHERRPAVFAGKGLYWVGAYLAWLAIELTAGIPEAGGNHLNPVSMVLLGFATVALAFTMRTVSGRVLRGNDISYGVYIYHMPVVNLLLFVGVTGALGAVLAAVATVLCALLSWLLVEKPALRLKGYSARW